MKEQSNAGAKIAETPDLGKSDIHQQSITELKEIVERFTMALRKKEHAMKQAVKLLSTSQVNSIELESSHAVVPRKVQVINKIKVFVVDSDSIFYRGLRLYLSKTHDTEVIGSYKGFSEETILLIEELTPDIVLVDVNMPSFSGLDFARQLRRHLPSTSVIMLAPYEEDNVILKAIKVDVAGYIGKNVASEILANAIRRVFSGERITWELLMKPRIAQQVLNQFKNVGRRGLSNSINPHDVEMLGYFANGYSLKQVARAMGMGDEVIKDSLASINSRLLTDGNTQ